MMRNGLNITERHTEYGLPYIEIRGCEDFQAAHIFECGQCFRWNRLPDSNLYCGVAGGRVAAVHTSCDATGTIITIANADLADFESFWKSYFDFERDYSKIKAELSKKDSYLREAAAFGNGIRILRQEPFETLISFILSANNNIPRIKGCIEKLSAAYGAAIEVSGAFYRYLREHAQIEEEQRTFYAFPTAEQLSNVTAEEISACCKAGYRCGYIEKTVRTYLKQPICPQSVCSGDRLYARKQLQLYAGVGPKVADCILLFTGMRTDVFPVDVWVRRVLERLYLHKEVPQQQAELFTAEYFGNLAGFAQQYLFYLIREGSRLKSVQIIPDLFCYENGSPCGSGEMSQL